MKISNYQLPNKPLPFKVEDICLPKSELVQLLQFTDCLIWVYDRKNKEVKYLNGNPLEELGIDEKNIINEEDYWLDRIHKEDRQAYNTYYENLELESTAASVEYRFIKENGECLYFEERCIGRYEDENHNCMYGITLNKSEYHKSKNKDKRFNSDIYSMIDGLSDAFYVLDNNDRFLFVNKAFEKMVGLNKMILLNRSLEELFAANEIQLFLKHLDILKATGEKQQYERYSALMKKWVRIYVYPMNLGVCVLLQDISEQVRIKKDLSHQQAIYKIIVDKSNDYIWSIDQDYNYLSCNTMFKEGMKAHFDLDIEVGKKALSGKVDQGPKELFEGYYRKGLSGEAISEEFEALTKDGIIIYFELRAVPIINDEGIVYGLSLFCRDITARKIAADRIEKQNKMLKKIAWVQAHEMRAQVANVIGLINVIDTSTIEDASNLENIHLLQQTALLLDDVIQNVITNAQAIEL